MKKPRILVVGSFVMDMIFRSKRFVQPGETILGLDFHSASGGKGANQAVQAARLGADVTMVGKVGKDEYGHAMLASLAQAGVNTQRVVITDAFPSGMSNIQVQSGGEGTQNRIMVIPGANMAITEEDIAFLQTAISTYDMVLLQLEIPMRINLTVARYAHAAGVPVMLNPAPSDILDDEFLALLDYIAPNEHEAKDITGIQPTDSATIAAAIDALTRRGVKNAILTLGDAGAAWGNGKRKWLCPAIPCEAVADPTAAGDSFIGSFCTAICAGMAVEDAMLFANQAASITVSRAGAQPSLPTLAEVNAALEKRSATRLEIPEQP